MIRLIGFLVRWAARAAGLLFIVGLLVRLTVRDRLPLIGTLYYMTPLPLLALAGGAVFLRLAWKGHRKTASVVFVVVCVVSSLWIGSSLHRQTWLSASAEARVMFWNTARGRLGYGGVIRVVKRVDPDLACFLEAPGLAQRLEEEMPDVHVVGVGRDFACLSKSKIREVTKGRLGPRGRYALLAVADADVRIVMTDVYSDPWRFRGPAIEEILQISTRAGERTIVMGDFNTPIDSVHFDAYHDHFDHAFRARGRGFIETWPLGIPLLSIDHIWVSRDIEVLRTRHLSTFSSDHAAIVTDLRFDEPIPGVKNVAVSPSFHAPSRSTLHETRYGRIRNEGFWGVDR